MADQELIDGPQQVPQGLVLAAVFDTGERRCFGLFSRDVGGQQQYRGGGQGDQVYGGLPCPFGPLPAPPAGSGGEAESGAAGLDAFAEESFEAADQAAGGGAGTALGPHGCLGAGFAGCESCAAAQAPVPGGRRDLADRVAEVVTVLA
ncbi:hypothetical protein [Streptomyces macrosporus]|uniref:hypothetical protein n=1 Tax=Streptomyces macrosporus TaxID=44032 RepID=UPI0031D82972